MVFVFLWLLYLIYHNIILVKFLYKMWGLNQSHSYFFLCLWISNWICPFVEMSVSYAFNCFCVLYQILVGHICMDLVLGYGFYIELHESYWPIFFILSLSGSPFQVTFIKWIGKCSSSSILWKRMCGIGINYVLSVW